MKIATWNVNSLRVRLPHLLDWLAAAQPDVACLQETKTEDANFPARRDPGRGLPGGVLRTEVLQRRGDPRALGADAMCSTASRTFRTIPKRVIAATVDGVRILNLYAPNGQEPGSDKYAYKLRWYAALTQWLKGEVR